MPNSLRVQLQVQAEPGLPTKIYEGVIEAVYDDRHTMGRTALAALSACALVCRAWRTCTQAVLFRCVLLRDRDALYRFAELLVASPQLGGYVRTLDLRGRLHVPYSPAVLFPTVLRGKLTNLLRLCMSGLVGGDTAGPLSEGEKELPALPIHPYFPCLLTDVSHIRQLSLVNVRFPSFGDLARILNSLSNLEVLVCLRVSWAVLGHLPPCMSRPRSNKPRNPFLPNMRRFQCLDMDELGTQRLLSALSPSLRQAYFPTHRLSRVLRKPQNQPLVLVACGSFNPITYCHLRMFEMAKDYVHQNTDFEIVGGYFSPVSGQLNKPGLLSTHHRVKLCNLAAEESSQWLMVDPWEAFQPCQSAGAVLDHFDHEINTRLAAANGAEHKSVRIMLLAGSDFMMTMSEPGIWSECDLDHVLGRYGVLVIEREDVDMDRALDILSRWRHNIHIIHQPMQNNISSSKVRLLLRRGLSVRYLLPTPVLEYIEGHGLYTDHGRAT